MSFYGGGDGELEFRDGIPNTILEPSAVRDRPRPEYLREGLLVRGWEV